MILLSGFGAATWALLEDGRDVVGAVEELVTQMHEECASAESGFGEGRAVGFHAAG